jgi:hypothetical protein
LRGPAKPRNHSRPVFIYKRFVSHLMLESCAIPTRKSKLNAYARMRVTQYSRGLRDRPG